MRNHFQRIALNDFKSTHTILSPRLIRWCSYFDRRNEVQIQMIDDRLRKKLFGKCSNLQMCNQKLNMIKEHLRKHGLWESKSKKLGKCFCLLSFYLLIMIIVFSIYCLI